MNHIVEQYLMAHARYSELDRIRVSATQPAERELIHIEIMRAYLELQECASVICGIQHAEGMSFAEAN